MENWTIEQSKRNNLGFAQAMLTKYPEASRYTSDPEKYFERVCVECNYLNAIKILDWKNIIPKNARILDLAGGTGWLSAYLSAFENVELISIVDMSDAYLRDNLPVSVSKLNGNIQKIKPIEGFFSPLLLPDNSIDLVVVSSSLHHADNLEAVITEIQRVLIPGGYCYILNETPAGNLQYLKTMLITFARIFLKIIKREFVANAPSISASGFLYDPLLGDRMHPDWYWQEAIKRAGLILEQRIDSGMATVKDSPGLPLIHYLCKKN